MSFLSVFKKKKLFGLKVFAGKNKNTNAPYAVRHQAHKSVTNFHL